MKKTKWMLLGLVVASLTLFLGIGRLSMAESVNLDSQIGSQIRYKTVERSQYTIHTITVPANSNYLVIPQVAGELKSLTKFAEEFNKQGRQNKVIAAINGGYFDPVNQKTTSFITKNSQIAVDPRFNERLVDNPDLKQYLGKIFNRAEFRHYRCGTENKYDIRLHFAPIPAGCTLQTALGAGPGLLPQDTSKAEAFIAEQDGKRTRDAIGRDSLNARSAVGINAQGGVILAMVEQLSEQPLNYSGISLPDLTRFLSSLGAVKAMNLDGGSSASLYYDGQTINGRVDSSGNKIQRPIKSILQVIKSK